jgi:AraC-like DNA-binding protein
MSYCSIGSHSGTLQNLAAELISLYDELPGILFWMKDAQLRLLEVNTAFAIWVNLPKCSILGKTDADLYFPELARGFMTDDAAVLRTGKAITRKGELLTNRFGIPEWRSISKRPVFDNTGKTVATIGISRPLQAGQEPLPAQFEAIRRIMVQARAALAEGIDVPQLAAWAGMSPATLNRLFRKHLKISPGDFLRQMRISRACRLLQDSPLNITEISQHCGYESPAAFTRAFGNQMQMAPKLFRARYQ